MKLAFALVLMGTTLGVGHSVLAAGQGGVPMTAIAAARQAPAATLTLIDDDGEEGEGGWFWSLAGDDDEDDCEGEGEDDDDGCAPAAAGNAAKAGTVAPPQNGLFTNGTAPVVQSN